VHSPLFVQQAGQILEEIMSQQGCRQGCPGGGLMFELGLLGPLRRTTEAFPDIKILAFFDNVHVAAQDPNRAIEASEFLDKEAAKVGLVARPEKSALLFMTDSALPEQAAAHCRDKGIPVEREAAVVLGAPVGRNADLMKEILATTLKRHDRFFETIHDQQLPPQESMLLLSRSGVPRISYLMRCVSPELLTEVAREFDSRVMAAACAKLRIRPDASTQMAREQLKLPVRLSGWGLRPAEHTLHFAFFGALAASSVLLCKLFPAGLPVAFAASVAASWANITSRLNPRGDTPVEVLPDRPDETLEFYRRDRDAASKLQRVLTAMWEESAFRALKLCDEATQDDVRRLDSLAEQMSGAWVATIPCTSRLSINDRLYRLAARLRLGLPPADHMPERCACGANLANGNWIHLMGCKKFSPNLVIHRHNAVVECTARAVRRVGGSARAEPRHLRYPKDDRRPDIEVWLGQEHILVDCTIRKPVPGEPLEATRLASRQKHRKYDDQAQAVDAKVVPFAVETFGAWGKEATAFARLLQTRATDRGINPLEFYYHFCSELSITLQIGNAKVLESALQAARSGKRPLSFPRSLGQVPSSLRVEVLQR
jgi:hypothetical protein